MSEAVLFSGPQDSSPRSTIFNAPSMTTALPVMNEATTITSDDVSGKVIPHAKDSSTLDHHHHPKAPEVHKVHEHEAHFSAPPTPISSHPEYTTYLHYSNPTPTSQAGGSQGGGYYLGYLPPQMIPEPDSPSRHPYDTFFHSGAAAFHPPPPFRHGPKTPPARGMAVPANLTPSSPVLFPRVSVAGSYPPGAPSIPYMASPPFPGSEQVYLGTVSNSSDEGLGAWNGPSGDSRNTYSHSATSQGMQQMHYGGMTVTRATSGGRAYSFEGESMLPPSALDDPGNPAYSPYTSASPNSGFASWGGGYGSVLQPGDPYGSPTSPLQPRPTVQMGMIPPSPLPGGGMRLYGTNYAATSPGLPIQTTASNKGPDGANLFIFHIPNHYTNLDMYHLFLPYGNLLSVRIMVERETGRSRGFGFVSYDTPEAAAMAIKELNGYPIGNKRLKVQHKQIRRHDLQDVDPDGFGADFGPGGYPPSGPNANLWFDTTENPIDIREEITPETEESEVEPKPVDAPPTLDYLQSSEGEEPVLSSPLATLGQLQENLPTIEGNVAEEEGKSPPGEE